MTTFVFAGPTLSILDARAELDAIYLPPVAQGDVYRVTKMRPQAIGIIDGYFEREPAVWHKEILWAMSQGIHVFGSASMGALRAAELAAFGMEGVGEIFEAFRDGVLEDDDEVAVSHGPRESDYRVMSEAMVNVRATLSAAQVDGVIDATTAHVLQDAAKALFYPDRTYPALLRCGAGLGVPRAQIDSLRDWLPGGRVDQKRTDALAMLREMRQRFAGPVPPKRVQYTFSCTEQWDQLASLAGEVHIDAGGNGETLLLERLLDEVRLGADSAPLQGALLRFLAVELGRRTSAGVSPEQIDATTAAFRRERNLVTPEQLQRWLEENRLDVPAFSGLMEDEVHVRIAGELANSPAVSYVEDYLRVAGDYARVLERAVDKQRLLHASGLANAGLDDIGITEAELLRWYFTTRLGREVDSDLASYARAVGFADADALRRALVREHAYQTTRDAEGRAPSRAAPKAD